MHLYSTIEELSVVIRWVENGLSVEHFIELVPLRKADATIYETLTDYMKKKGLMISNMIGRGFGGATAFSARHNGVQAILTTIHLTQFLCTATAISCNWL